MKFDGNPDKSTFGGIWRQKPDYSGLKSEREKSRLRPEHKGEALYRGGREWGW